MIKQTMFHSNWRRWCCMSAMFLAFFLTFFVDLCLASPARQRLVVFMDCSGSMKKKEKTDSRYREASKWVMNEIRVNLDAGHIVEIYPFDEQVLDNGNGRSYSLGDGDNLVDVMEDVRHYLSAYEPRSGSARTGIWASVKSKMQNILSNEMTTTISIYTDGEDNSSARGDEAIVRGTLERTWKSREDQGSSIRVWKWEKNKVLAPRVAVKLTSGTEITLRRSDFSSQNGTSQYVGVELIVAGETGSDDGLTAVEASVRPISAGAPHITVKPSFDVMPTVNNRIGQVKLELNGQFPDEEFSYEYVVDLRFEFESTLDRLDNQYRRQTLIPGQSISLYVSSKPVPFLGMDQSRELQMYPGQRRDIPFTVYGNADAAGMTCLLTALVPEGIEVGFQAIGSGADSSLLGSDRANIIIKKDQAKTDMLFRINAKKPTSGVIFLSAMVGGATKSVRFPFLVVQPTIEWGLARPLEKTELPGMEDQDNKKWNLLGAGPLVFKFTDGVDDATQLSISIEGIDPEGAEVAFDKTGKKKEIVTVGQAQTLDLFARWSKIPPPEFPKMPVVKLSVPNSSSYDYEIKIIPDQISLARNIAFVDADFWIASSASVVDKKVGLNNTLTINKKSLMVTRSDESDLFLEWNADAARKELPIRIISQVNGDRMEISTEVLGSALKKKAVGTDDQGSVYTLGRDEEGRTRVGLRVKAVAGNKTGSGSGLIRIISDDKDLLEKQIEINMPYEITPAIFKVKSMLDSRKDVPLFLGASLPIGGLEVVSGGLEGKILSEIMTDFSDIKIDCSINTEDKSDLKVPEIGTVSATIFAKPGVGNNPQDIIGKTVPSTLVLTSDDPKSILLQWADEKDSKPSASLEKHFNASIEAWSLKLFYDNRDAAMLPPNDYIRISKEKSTVYTSKWQRPLEIRIDGSIDVPDHLSDFTIKFNLDDDTLSFLDKIGFEVSDVVEPQDSVTVGQILNKKVKGLVFVAKEGLANEGFGNQYKSGMASLICEDLGMKLDIPVKGAVEGRSVFKMVIVIAAIITALCVLMIWWRKRHQRVLAPINTLGPIDFEDTKKDKPDLFGDELFKSDGKSEQPGTEEREGKVLRKDESSEVTETQVEVKDRDSEEEDDLDIPKFFN